jgi:type I restriction enzyme, S subunit
MRREEGFTFSDLEQGYQGVSQGDLVFHGLDGFAGAFGVAVAGGRCSPVCHVMTFGADNPHYMAYALRVAAATGLLAVHVPSTRQRAVDLRNWSTFAAISLPRPPLAEQRRIADFLDDQVALLDRAIALRESQSRLLEEHANSTIDEALRSWSDRTVPIASVCSGVVDCVNKTAPTSVEPTEFKMIRTTNVRNGFVDLTITSTVDESTFHLWNRRGAPRRGDVLLTREAPLGEVGLLDTDKSVFLGQRIVLYRPDPAETCSEFLLLSLLSPAVQSQIQLRSAGSLHAHLRVGDCLKIQIPAVPIQEQRALVRALTLARETDLWAAQRGKQQAVLLTERKESLINAAVTGEFDVTTARSVA